MKELISILRKSYADKLNDLESKEFKNIVSNPIEESVHSYYEIFTDWIVTDQSLIDKSDLSLFMDTDEDWEETELEFLEAHFNKKTSHQEDNVIENRMRHDEEFLEFYVVQEIIHKAQKIKKVQRKVPVVEAQLREEGFFEEIKKKIENEQPLEEEGRVISMKAEDSSAKSTGITKATASSKSDVSKEMIPGEGGGKVFTLKQALAAAASVLLLVSGFFFLRPDSLDPTVVASYETSTVIDNLNNLGVREINARLTAAGAAPTNMSPEELINVKESISAFNDNQYETVIQDLATSESNQAKYLKALSLWKTKKYAESKLTFQNLLTSSSDNLYIEVSSKWHLALLYLKEGNTTKAKELLTDISSAKYNTSRYKDYSSTAKKLLDEL